MYWFLKPVFVLSLGIIMTWRNFRSTQRLYGHIREQIIWALELNHKCGVTNWTIRASRHHLDWFPQLKLNIIAWKKKDSFVEAIFTVARLISVNDISSFMTATWNIIVPGMVQILSWYRDSAQTATSSVLIKL